MSPTAKAFARMTPALVVRRGTELHGVTSASSGLTRLPLPEASLRWPRELRALADAWRRLAEVRVASPDALADVLHALLDTVADPELEPAAGPLLRLELPRVVAPTANHPRAFRGTRSKPPRAPLPPAVDLRPS